MNRYFWIAQFMVFSGVCLRFGLVLLPLSGGLDVLGWWRRDAAVARTAGYARRFGLLGLGGTLLWLAIVRYGFGYHVFFVDNAWWFTMAMLAGGLLLAGLGALPARWPLRLIHLALLAAMIYLILTVPYVRSPSRWLNWLYCLAPTVFILYLPPLIRALSSGAPDSVAVTRLLWFVLAPALAIFHATYHFGLTVLASFSEGAEIFPVVTVYRGMMPLFLAMFLYTVWCQFWVVGRTTLPARSAWLGLLGGYTGALLAAAMLWFGVTLFDTLAL